MADNHASYSHTVTELFEQQVLETPEAVAIHHEGQQLTYNQLNKKANQIALFFQKKNVQPHDFVALSMDSGIDFIVCILGILKAGGAYLPVDTLAPTHRLEEIIEDSNPKIIISSKKYIEKYGLKYDTVFEVSGLMDETNDLASDNISSLVVPTSPSYMMYTSGSTGRPKGVIISHQSVVNLAKMVNYAGMNLSSRMGQFSNLAFDASTMEIWGVLLNGATLYIVPPSAKKNPLTLKLWLSQHDIKHLYLPTAYFHQMVKSMPHVIDELQRLIIGGEQVNASLLSLFIAYRKTESLPITLVNAYGPTEATTTSTCHIINLDSEIAPEQLSSIGKPIENVKTYVLDENMQPVVLGELYISGVNLALGYHNNPNQNEEKFIKNPFCVDEPYQQLYKTGDLVRQLANGDLLYIERLDDQVKINGFRVHTGEIENKLMNHPLVSLAVVLSEKGGSDHNLLTAYIVPSSDAPDIDCEKIKEYLLAKLPPYMLPNNYYFLESIPLTSLGKVDKKKLILVNTPSQVLSNQGKEENNIEKKIQVIWANLLNLDSLDVNKNLFDMGANSLLMIDACFQINNELQSSLDMSQVLEFPTIRKLSELLKGHQETQLPRRKEKKASEEIAVIGMSCRFPKSSSINEYWDNLCQGNDCLTRFGESELDHIDADRLADQNFIPVRGVLDDIAQFDAHFFGFSPSDASIIDPQQRVFFECAWEALEHSGNVPDKNRSKLISVYAGMADSSYLNENLLKNDWFCQNHDRFQARIATSGGMLSTQVSYRLNLQGKSININTACSTGLVAIAEACKDLMAGSTDMALAGAVSIVTPQADGYFYQKDSIESPDGQCRPFSCDANGTVFSNGAGVVILKRLSDAIADNDTIFAIVKGCGVNNDGSDKLSYTAPSIHGQESCINMAFADAKISPESIGFIEAHGTGTALGDVIEVAALKKAYRYSEGKKEQCVLGSVKGNIGHTDIASGIAGFIKTVLCLYHQKIPPTVHYQSPNPNLNLLESPFYINNHLMNWDNGTKKQYAAVSALGVGGTNAHVILQAYHPPLVETEETIDSQLFIFSAKTKNALQQHKNQITQHLNRASDEHSPYLQNVAYTLQRGRSDFQWRHYVVGERVDEVIDLLNDQSPLHQATLNNKPAIVFMFPGQGTQYHSMAAELYQKIPYFSHIVDNCARLAEVHLKLNICSLLFNSNLNLLHETQYAQLALFIIEYALAKLLIYYGIEPSALLGHSSGEYVAACLAGVFSLEEAIFLIYQRGQLMSELPKGAMLAIACSRNDFLDYKKDLEVELSIENTTKQCVVSGTEESITKLQKILDSHNIIYQQLNVGHAFHNQVMALIRKPFREIINKIKLSPPRLPVVSNVSGLFLTDTQATDPDYWYQHLRQPVQFKKSIETLVNDSHTLFVEVGPGCLLTTFTKEIANENKRAVSITHVLPKNKKSTREKHQLLTAIGTIWQNGASINWQALHADRKCQYISLPTYPFQKQHYWVTPDSIDRLISNKEKKQMFFQPSWLRHEAYTKEIINPTTIKNALWIIFKDTIGLADALLDVLQTETNQVVIVEQGIEYKMLDRFHYVINPSEKAHYTSLFNNLNDYFNTKDPIILHCFSYVRDSTGLLTTGGIENQLNLSFYSLLYLSQAYSEQISDEILMKCAVMTSGSQKVLDIDSVSPVTATLSGAHRVINQEHPLFKLQLIDISHHAFFDEFKAISMTIINHCTEHQWEAFRSVLALRNGYHWQYTNEAVELSKKIDRFKDNGVYVLTGGQGGVALEICKTIAKRVSNPTLVLISRTATPESKEWDGILKNSSHPLYKKIKSLVALQKMGCRLGIYQADVGCRESISSVIKLVNDNFGTINGLIHAAGIPGNGLVQLKDKDAAHQVLIPKVYGTYNLASAFKDIKLDFVALFSSISALTGEIGQVDYASANACLDAFAISNLFSATHTVSINWNTWREIGMTVTVDGAYNSDFLDRGNDISPEDGQEIFLKMISNNQQQVIVSNMNLVEFSKKSTLHQQIKHIAKSNKTHRDVLNVTSKYVSPQSLIEEQMVILWQEKLGIHSIGISDDFFELGGHSLKALDLIDAINKKIHSHLQIQDLYEAKTISGLSSRINASTHPRSDRILVPLSVTNNELPSIFVCHPLSGMVYCYTNLISLWELPLSIYGLQDPSITNEGMLFDNITHMAQTYLDAIKKIQPKGPYHFIGYSFGANVLHEVVHLLKQQNETIGVFAIIDGWAVFSKEEVLEKQFKKQFLQYHPDLSDEIISLSWKRMKMLFNYLPSKINQDVFLFKANELLEQYVPIDHASNGWSYYNSGQISCHLLPANHETILDEHNISIILNTLQKELVSQVSLSERNSG